MTLACNLTESDYRAFRRHIMFRYRKLHWLYGGMLGLVIVALWFGGGPEKTLADKIGALIAGAVAFCGAVLFLSVVRRFTRTGFRGTLGAHTFEISDQGITESNVNGKVETLLPAIRRIDETARHFFVVTTSGVGHVLPKRDLPSFDAIRSLRARSERAKP
jgi:hypothetical protein